MMTASSTDRIEKEVRLPASRARVWHALTDAREFGIWFGVEELEPFVAGAKATGKMTYKGQPFTFEVIVDTMEAERHFSFWWRPYAVDPNYDYSGEPRTLVSFTLDEDGDATVLRVVESGFDAIPASRRTMAFEMNTGGWTSQMKRIANYLASHP